MEIYCLEQQATDVPAGNSWLSEREILCLDGFRFAKRRVDWRLGRWTAKLALAYFCGLSRDAQALRSMAVHPAPSGAPEAFIENKPAKIAISLTHRLGRSLCTIAAPDVKLGCDLEAIEPRSDAFIADYFTAEEQEIIARAPAWDRNRTIALIWSAKESALKALKQGLRLQTQSVVVHFEPRAADPSGWGRLHVYYENSIFEGWWRRSDELVRTVIADSFPGQPIPLGTACYRRELFDD